MPQSNEADDGAEIVAAETIMETGDLRVARLTLAPHGLIPWHRHSAIADHFVCLRGRIEIETRDPADRAVLAPGEEFQAEAGTPHQVRNLGAEPACYLIVQGVGTYDRIVAPPPADG